MRVAVIEDVPWPHAVLCASRCEGRLGNVASDITRFGVSWGIADVAEVSVNVMYAKRHWQLL